MIRAALALLSCLLLAVPSRAELQAHSGIRGPRAFQRAYDRLPPRVQRTPVSLRYRDGMRLHGKKLDGFYDPETRAIYVDPDAKEPRSTFLHELGHHAHVTALTRAEWQVWEPLWQARKKQMPSAYARIAPAEGFAECFKVWVRGGSLHRDLRAFFDRAYPRA